MVLTRVVEMKEKNIKKEMFHEACFINLVLV